MILGFTTVISLIPYKEKQPADAKTGKRRAVLSLTNVATQVAICLLRVEVRVMVPHE